MFILTEDEINYVVSQNVIPSKQYLGGAKPFAFTENGVAMLSSVLKTKRAKEMNIAIIRTFVALRKVAVFNSEILVAIEKIQNKNSEQDEQINLIFKYLKQLEKSKNEEQKFKERPKIGFKSNEE